MRAMKLSDYLAERKLKPSQFAGMLGVTPSTLSRILRGHRKPSIALASKIDRETRGMVSVHDWNVPQSQKDRAA